MQRAAASTPPATPQSETNDAEPPPSKRQKTSNVPSSPAGDSSMTDLQMIQRALDEEEQKRVRAIEKLAEDAGETKWVLSTVRGNIEEDGPNLHVTTAGYSEIDEGTWRPHMLGRRSFGRFNRQLEVNSCVRIHSRTAIGPTRSF